MTRIELGKEGKFLSGRSRAVEILKKYDSISLKNDGVEINFQNVESCSQSFISELIVQLKGAGVQKGNIKVTSVADKDIEKRVVTELHRLEMV